MFEAGCHAMLASVAGRAGSGIDGSERSSEEETAMRILRGVIEGGYRDQRTPRRVFIASAAFPVRLPAPDDGRGLPR